MCFNLFPRWHLPFVRNAKKESAKLMPGPEGSLAFATFSLRLVITITGAFHFCRDLKVPRPIPLLESQNVRGICCCVHLLKATKVSAIAGLENSILSAGGREHWRSFDMWPVHYRCEHTFLPTFQVRRSEHHPWYIPQPERRELFPTERKCGLHRSRFNAISLWC